MCLFVLLLHCPTLPQHTTPSIIYYIKLQCPFVCVCVCLCVCVSVYVCMCVCVYPPFFRHDRLTATEFGTHVRIDPGIIRAQHNFTHPTPGGFAGGGGGGQNSKVQEMS